MNISVVIPTFKRPALLIQCLQNLAQQTFAETEYEVIVVSDGTDMDTKNAVTNFSQHQLFLNLGYYELDEKKGPAAARNKGVQYAKGELIIFTDDDCLPRQNWLEAYWNAYEKSDKKEIAFTGKTIVPHSDTPTDYEKNISHLQKAEFITANCAITKTAFKNINGFDEEFSIAWREDSELHFKLIKAIIPIHQVKNAAVVHPVRKTKWGISLKEQKKSLFNALLYKKHPELYAEKINAPVWNYYAMVSLFIFFIMYAVKGFYIAASVALLLWFLFLIQFIFKRLKETSKKISHVFEMIITSAFIPFLSVFWTLYGAFKYKTFFL